MTKNYNKKCEYQGCDKFARGLPRLCVSHGGKKHKRYFKNCCIQECTNNAINGHNYCIIHDKYIK